MPTTAVSAGNLKKHPMLDVSAWQEANRDESLIIADGKSVTLQVHGGMLVINDGPMGDARKRSFARVPRTVKHVAIFDRHGYVSLDAMAWLADCEVTWAVIDRQGRLPRTLATSGGYVNPLYMRRQAMCAPGMPAAFTGVQIVRGLIETKLEGQAHNAEYALHDAQTAGFIRAQIPHVLKARSVGKIMGYEGTAADAYWDAWRGMVIDFKRPGPRQPHWIVFPSRRTLRRSWESNRGATDPVNAMLNFGYKVAEVECTLACYGAALSPAMGMMHVDRAGRDSFALDLIEVMRPIVDRIVIDILARPLDKRWFREDTQGMVQCCAPLTHKLYSEVHRNNYQVTRALFGITGLLDSSKRISAKLESITQSAGVDRE